MFCPGYRMGVCSCKTTLRRDRAERLILGEIGRRILANPAWRDVVVEEMQRAWKAQESQLARVKREEAKRRERLA